MPSRPHAAGLSIAKSAPTAHTQGHSSSTDASSGRTVIDTYRPLPSPPLQSPTVSSPPPASPRHARGQSKNFLSHFKTRISPEHDHCRSRVGPIREEDERPRRTEHRMTGLYSLRKNTGSTPELSLIGSTLSVNHSGHHVSHAEGRQRPTPHNSQDSFDKKRKEKAHSQLGRSTSLRRDQARSRSPDKHLEHAQTMPPPDSGLLKTKRGERRGKSVERIAGKEEEQHQHQHQPADGARGRAHSNQRAKDKERGGGLFTGSKNVVSKATKGGGNFLVRLGKMGRSSSNAEKEVPDSEYQLKVINRPLAEQARITRISKDLSSCRDKTEYWMPSLPWRCIDYLNSNCESEGLYRIPGGVLQVRHWQRRFDQELDIDLLDEKDLYDPNEIGSVLKKWLTDLPTEMMPLSLQQSLAAELEQENPDFKNIGQPAPQRLRDVLSELPPFNYYLLFAVTCHLSLLLSNQDKNKMDLHNLNICIGPCLKLERWLFNYLVGDWRHCWQGCFTEKQYLEAEKALEQNKILRSNSSPATSRTGSQAPVGSDESVDSSADRVSEDTRDARPRAENKRLVDAFKTRGQQQRDPSPRDRRLPALTARPTTSDCDSEFDTVRGLPSDITRPPLVTRNTHSRSKSDVPPTPSKVAGYPGGDSWFNLPSR